MTVTRAHVLELFGRKIELPWTEKFRSKFDASTDYPDMAELQGAWNEISAQLFPALEQATDEDLDRKLDYELPHGENTVRGAVVFFTYHEAWHLGQIAFVRKSTGNDGLVPY